MVYVFAFNVCGLYFNLKYNFWFDFKNEGWTYICNVWIPSAIVLIANGLSAYYCFSMLTWYFGMASRGVHAVEESMAGVTYSKA